MNLSPAQKKVIERLGDGGTLKKDGQNVWWFAEDGLHFATWNKLETLGLIHWGGAGFMSVKYGALTSKGQQLYEDMKKK